MLTILPRSTSDRVYSLSQEEARTFKYELRENPEAFRCFLLRDWDGLNKMLWQHNLPVAQLLWPEFFSKEEANTVPTGYSYEYLSPVIKNLDRHKPFSLNFLKAYQTSVRKQWESVYWFNIEAEIDSIPFGLTKDDVEALFRMNMERAVLSSPYYGAKEGGCHHIYTHHVVKISSKTHAREYTHSLLPYNLRSSGSDYEIYNRVPATRQMAIMLHNYAFMVGSSHPEAWNNYIGQIAYTNSLPTEDEVVSLDELRTLLKDPHQESFCGVITSIQAVYDFYRQFGLNESKLCYVPFGSGIESFKARLLSSVYTLSSEMVRYLTNPISM